MMMHAAYQIDTSIECCRSKVTATFQISGPYHLMKRFVHSVEIFSKFLIVEKIDFADINMQSGGLKLKIVLAGYYED